jgi:Adenylate and Guanylate cyclase catalytic domain
MVSCPACGKANPDGFRFCGFCTAPLDEAPAASGLEERKVVSVLFCDLVGFTAASEVADPEDVRARLRPYHGLLRERIVAFGGTVEKFVGDAVTAVFGAPVAHEDDAERAVRAGLAILESLAVLNEADPALSLSVRVGVNTGEALVALDARPEQGEGFGMGSFRGRPWSGRRDLVGMQRRPARRSSRPRRTAWKHAGLEPIGLTGPNSSSAADSAKPPASGPNGHAGRMFHEGEPRNVAVEDHEGVPDPTRDARPAAGRRRVQRRHRPRNSQLDDHSLSSRCARWLRFKRRIGADQRDWTMQNSKRLAVPSSRVSLLRLPW